MISRKGMLLARISEVHGIFLQHIILAYEMWSNIFTKSETKKSLSYAQPDIVPGMSQKCFGNGQAFFKGLICNGNG